MITAPSLTGRHTVPSVFSNFNLKGAEEGFLQVTPSRLKCNGCVGISRVNMGEGLHHNEDRYLCGNWEARAHDAWPLGLRKGAELTSV